MEFSVDRPGDLKTDVLIAFSLQGKPSKPLESLDAKLGHAACKAVEGKEFAGKANQLLNLHTLGRLKASRLLLVGLGKPEDFTLDHIREAAARAFTFSRDTGAKSLAFHLDTIEGKGSLQDFAQAVVEGTSLASYRYVKYKTQDLDELKAKEVTSIALLSKSPAAKTGLHIGKTIAETVNHVRDLANDPANIATPTHLAEQCANLAKKHGLQSTILHKPELERLGAGGILSVGRGSSTPPCMVILEHKPAKAKATLAIVGKGITFDSGGISLKPSKDMEKMKWDKCGALNVLGTIIAAAQLELPIHLVALMGFAENVPSGTATKPGDVIKTLSGKTIEVVNTDAEGRVLLSDVLAYSARYKPDAIIDMATLTGAATVALGYEASALISNNSKLAQRVISAGEKTAERVWQLPSWKEYGDYNKSDIADIKNIGGRAGEAGTITAAKFLEFFVPEKTAWAHLDIASTAWNEKSRPYYPVLGATGVGIRLLIQMMQDW